MVKQTLNYSGAALPAEPDLTKMVPILVRLGYAWKALRGHIRIIGPVDVSHVKSDGYMEGRIRVHLSAAEADRYQVDSV